MKYGGRFHLTTNRLFTCDCICCSIFPEASIETEVYHAGTKSLRVWTTHLGNTRARQNQATSRLSPRPLQEMLAIAHQQTVGATVCIDSRIPTTRKSWGYFCDNSVHLDTRDVLTSISFGIQHIFLNMQGMSKCTARGSRSAA